MVLIENEKIKILDENGNDLEKNLSRLLSTIKNISFKLILAKLFSLVFFMLTCSGLFIDFFSTGQTILFGLIVVGTLLYADTKSNNLNFYKEKLLNTENKLNILTLLITQTCAMIKAKWKPSDKAVFQEERLWA